jgi:hypothetical protein
VNWKFFTNTNPDTLARALESFFERLETVENVMVAIPAVRQYIPAAEGATQIADDVTKLGAAAVDAFTGATAPKTPAAAPAPAPAAPVTLQPATELSATAGAPKAHELLKQALANATQDGA